MVQINANPLSNYEYNQGFEPMEYQNYIQGQRANLTVEQFESFFQQNNREFFGMWKRNIFNLVYQRCQIHLDDMPDFSYRMNFDDHVQPHQMAQHILDNIP